MVTRERERGSRGSYASYVHRSLSKTTSDQCYLGRERPSAILLNLSFSSFLVFFFSNNNGTILSSLLSQTPHEHRYVSHLPCDRYNHFVLLHYSWLKLNHWGICAENLRLFHLFDGPLRAQEQMTTSWTIQPPNHIKMLKPMKTKRVKWDWESL